jgi:hypothetical protein
MFFPEPFRTYIDDFSVFDLDLFTKETGFGDLGLHCCLGMERLRMTGISSTGCGAQTRFSFGDVMMCDPPKPLEVGNFLDDVGHGSLEERRRIEYWRTEYWRTEYWRTEYWRTEYWRTEYWRTEDGSRIEGEESDVK